MTPLPHSYRSALVSGLSHGFILPFSGCLVAVFFSSSMAVTIAVVLSLSLAGAIILSLARKFSEAEELSEFDYNAVQKEFNKEQRILTKIGISQQVLEPMQQEMNEEQRRRISELPAALPAFKSYKASLYLFAGYFICGLITALFVYISDAHLLIDAVMVLGVKFAIDLYKHSKIAKTAYPVLRSLLDIFAAAIIFAALYMLFKAVIV